MSTVNCTKSAVFLTLLFSFTTQVQIQFFKSKKDVVQTLNDSAICLNNYNNYNLFSRRKRPGGGHFRIIYETHPIKI